LSGGAVGQILAALVVVAPVDPLPPKRIAVLIVPVAPEDAELAENLTEVAISQLADRAEGELVGSREVRRYLDRADGERGTIACFRDIACIRPIAKALAVDKVVTGTLQRTDGGFTMALSLVDPASGAIERRAQRSAAEGADSQIHAVQDAIEELFSPAPLRASLSIPSEPPGATVVNDRHMGETPPPRRRWASKVAYGSAALALLSFAGAGVFGTLAAADPSGPTRAAAQRDLSLREDYATTANGLLIAGAAFAAVSAAVFVLLWRDVSSD
jgi:hypothetical protein